MGIGCRHHLIPFSELPVRRIPVDARARRIESGNPVQIFNNRGNFLAKAVVTERTRPGVLSAPSVWWNKLVPGGRNANSTTSEELTDIGGGATFYDNLVDVRLAD